MNGVELEDRSCLADGKFELVLHQRVLTIHDISSQIIIMQPQTFVQKELNFYNIRNVIRIYPENVKRHRGIY